MCLKIQIKKKLFLHMSQFFCIFTQFFVVTQVIDPISKFFCPLLQIFMSIGLKIRDLGKVVVALLRGKN